MVLERFPGRRHRSAPPHDRRRRVAAGPRRADDRRPARRCTTRPTRARTSRPASRIRASPRSGSTLTAHRDKPAGFFNPANPGDFGFVNSDLAFEGDHAFIGNFNGFQIYDISDPDNPSLVTAVVCPGGQGEVSVYGNLLFMSAEETAGRSTAR